MPSKPSRLCPRCQRVVCGPCAFCRRVAAESPERKEAARQYDERRGTAAERGYDRRWSAYSRARLAQHPLCASCERMGRLVAAEVTGHIVPSWAAPDRFWDETNHESLCYACNAVQDREDRKRYGKSGIVT